uniref:Uncharacterized protein n=1 Tax=Arundo donax TaxID=35708 RepID=A0A0A8ZCX5_ARUDO
MSHYTMKIHHDVVKSVFIWSHVEEKIALIVVCTSKSSEPQFILVPH